MTQLDIDQLAAVQGGQAAAWFGRIGKSPYYIKTGTNPNPGPLGTALSLADKVRQALTKQKLLDDRFNRMGGGKSEIGSNAVTRGESPDWYTNALGFILHP